MLRNLVVAIRRKWQSWEVTRGVVPRLRPATLSAPFHELGRSPRRPS